jgi:hypothetical protein
MFSAHTGNIQCTFSEGLVLIQGTLRAHSGNVQCTYRERSVHIQGTFSKHTFCLGWERGLKKGLVNVMAGVSKLVVVVNKMDDPSVNWSQERYDEVQSKLTPFLKQCGYNTKRDVTFSPVSGLMGYGIKVSVPLPAYLNLGPDPHTWIQTRTQTPEPEARPTYPNPDSDLAYPKPDLRVGGSRNGLHAGYWMLDTGCWMV